MIVCGTGPIVAAALVDDDHHHECVELFTGLHLAERALLVPGTVIVEVGYLLACNAGARDEALFLDAVADGDFRLMDLAAADVRPDLAQIVDLGVAWVADVRLRGCSGGIGGTKDP